MDKKQAAADIIAHALPLVAFEGWTQSMLSKASLAAGYKKSDAIRVFPNGTIQAVDIFLQNADAEMEKALAGYHLESMKIRERIATLVRIRILLHEGHREALRKALALLALPFYALHGAKNLYHTVDAIWHAAGDASTDFNFYTKRLTLAAVYSSTLLYWLDDKSAGYENTWAFLDRRIADVMKIEKAKSALRQRFSRVA